MTDKERKKTEAGLPIFSIPSFHYEAYKKKIARYQKKCAKLNVGYIKIQELGTRFKDVTYTYAGDMIIDSLGECRERTVRCKVEIFDITIEGEAPRLKGWKLIGRLEHDPRIGTILYAVPGEAIPKEYYNAEANCDHCKKGWLKRKDTFIVQNEKTKEYRQVGRRCIADFLGHPDAEKLAQYLEIFSKIIDLSSSELEDYQAADYPSIRGELYYGLEDYLSWTTTAIGLWGWMGTAKAREKETISTSEKVFNSVIDVRSSSWKAERYALRSAKTDEDVEFAKQAIGWAVSLSDDEANTDYLVNIQKIATAGLFTFRQKGYAASIAITYKNYLRRDEEKKTSKKDQETLEYYGNVGERIDLYGLTVLTIRSWENDYGMTYLYKFRKGNNVFTWFASNKLGRQILDTTCTHYERRVFTAIEEGATVDLRATIKDHDGYNGEKQTIITRGKLIEKGE